MFSSLKDITIIISLLAYGKNYLLIPIHFNKRLSHFSENKVTKLQYTPSYILDPLYDRKEPTDKEKRKKKKDTPD